MVMDTMFVDGVPVPKKCIMYAKRRWEKDRDHLLWALNTYKIVGRMKPQKVAECIDKFTNTFVDRITEQLVITHLGKTDFVEGIITKLLDTLEPVTKEPYRKYYELLMPILWGWCEFPVIVSKLAQKKSQLYLALRNTQGGMEWLKNLCVTVQSLMAKELSPECRIEYWEITTIENLNPEKLQEAQMEMAASQSQSQAQRRMLGK